MSYTIYNFFKASAFTDKCERLRDSLEKRGPHNAVPYYETVEELEKLTAESRAATMRYLKGILITAVLFSIVLVIWG